MEQKIRFLLSRDDYYHQRGYWVLAKAFTRAGIEVVLGGIQTPNGIAPIAVQEAVDIIGYRIMNGDPKILISLLFDEMSKQGIGQVPVVVGGIIPKKDEDAIKGIGVKEVFHPYTPLESVVESVKAIGNEGRKYMTPRNTE
ncbi:MAG: methylmalonyl-CoA mutase [Desulfobacteraceae bacterium]|uniref:Methylmalonyl-CoA mutase n=1 Tax=Candidatus Desulfacyla euxinica TaxID=2841693 RepID=A0A8J6MZP5_9DELT|nr:methylmalonyl-CoA mutase [Candidatus Desulfacyla euxinica]MBL6977710.1 methylmalonyl-CoA mutase [Desulfobacteraceae bacterium]